MVAGAAFFSPLLSFEGTVGEREMFQNPSYSGSTRGLDSAFANDALRSAGFGGSDGVQALEIFFDWADASDPYSWVRLTTNNGAVYPNPAVDLRGKITFTVNNLGNFSDGDVGLCVAIRETDVLTSLLANGGTAGPIELVGVNTSLSVIEPGDNEVIDSTLAGDDIAWVDGAVTKAISWGPNQTLDTPVHPDDVAKAGYIRAADDGGFTPVPAVTVPVSDFTFKNVEVDLATGQIAYDGGPPVGGVAGFTGDGVLSTPTNKAVFEALVITNIVSDTGTSIDLYIDELQFQSPEADPTPPPSIQAPVISTDTQVLVNCLQGAVPAQNATLAELLINDTSQGTQAPDGTFVATFSGLTLQVGDVLTARQQANGIWSEESSAVVVYGPGTALADNFDSYTDQAGLEGVWQQTDPANALKFLLSTGSASSCDNFVMADYPTAPSVSKLYYDMGVVDGSDAEPLLVTYRFKHDDNSGNARARFELTSALATTFGAVGFAFTNGIGGVHAEQYTTFVRAPGDEVPTGFVSDYFTYDYGATGIPRESNVWHKMQIEVKTDVVNYYFDDQLVNTPHDANGPILGTNGLPLYEDGVPRISKETPFQYIVLGVGFSNNGPAEMYDDISVTLGGTPIPFGPPNPVNSPVITGPLYPGVTTLELTEVDDTATQIAVYANAGASPIATDPGPFAGGVATITVPPLIDGDEITVTQTVGGTESCLSAGLVVNVPAVTLPDILVPGQTAVDVSNIAEGLAEAVTVYRLISEGNYDELGSLATPATDPATVTTTALVDGHTIVARQTIGGVEGPDSAPVTVAVPAPILPGPVTVGDTTVTVEGVHPLATDVTAYVNGTPYTATAGGPATVDVPVPLLTVGDSVYATQTIGGVEGPQSNTLTVVRSLCLVAFADDFDAGTSSGGWTLLSSGTDYTANFAFDYSVRGIPTAPNSVGGSTIGLYFDVNNNDAVGATEGVSIFPIGQSFSGDYALKFDMWINYNGGAGGGSGSTENATAGLNHTGTQVVWANNASSDGDWFTTTGEGGAARDYRAYIGPDEQLADTGIYTAPDDGSGNPQNHFNSYYQALFPTPPFETTGAPGKQWVEVEISQINGVVEWKLNGAKIAAHSDATYTSGNIMIGYMDLFTSIANPAVDNFVVYDNIRVTVPRPTAAQGDWNGDGNIDLDDYVALEDCLGGPALPPQPGQEECGNVCLEAFDFDLDNDIDAADFGAFQELF
jgi:hypothetical protein